jgi:hypothetical protein
MPMYLATYEVEVIHETSGEFMNFEEEYEFFAENDDEAQDIANQYVNGEIFDVIMSNISIVPGDLDVEELEEEEDNETE